jgi:hypothetical protein
VQGLYHAQDALMAKIIAGGRHSDQTLAQQKAKRVDLRNTIANVACDALLAALKI